MARINICGFETGDSSEAFSTGGTFSIQTTTKRSGTYALRTNPVTTAEGWFEIAGLAATGVAAVASVTTAFIRCYFQYATKPAANNEIILYVLDTGGTGKINFRIDSTGKLSAWNFVTQIGSTGTTALVANVWYRLEFSVGTGATAPWAVLIDGIPEISGTDTLESALAAGSFRFGKANNLNGNTVDFFYDDIAIDDTNYPGPGSIQRLAPSATVANTNWTNEAAGAATFASVDEVPTDDDATYVVTSTAGTQTFTVSFTALSTKHIIATMSELKLITWARDTGTALNYQIQIRPASNAVSTTAADGGNTYAVRAVLYKAIGGTDVLSIANINTCQASIIKTQAQARELRCTTMMVMVAVPGDIGSIIRNRSARLNPARVSVSIKRGKVTVAVAAGRSFGYVIG